MMEYFHEYIIIQLESLFNELLSTKGIGSVLTSAIFSVLDIDPVINAVISLDQCK